MNKRTPAYLVLKSAVLFLSLLCFYPLSATNPQKKEMKELNVKKVSLANVAVENIPALLDKEKVAFQSINTVNWKAFPYQPEVQFRIAHTDDAILVHYKVKEASVRAVATGDNGAVWEDACVEFFSIPAGDGIYYNVECNCVGTLLIGAGGGRSNRGRHSRNRHCKKSPRQNAGRAAKRANDTSYAVAPPGIPRGRHADP